MEDGTTDDRSTTPMPYDRSTTKPMPYDPLANLDAQADEQARIQYAAGTARVLPPVPPARDPWWNPTLTDLSETPSAAAVRRRPRRRGWLAVGLAAVLVIAGGSLAYAQLRSHPGTPAQAIRQYFADLATGDTNAAMALVDNTGTYTASAYPLLSATALADAGSRPGHVTIGGSARTSVGGGRSGTAVSISYRAGGTTVHQTITVVAAEPSAAGVASTSKQPFRLVAPFVTLVVGANNGRPMTVNGVPYSGGSAHTLAFPGAYVANIAGDQLFASESAAATYHSGSSGDSGSSGAVEADIALPAPTAAPGATAAVQQAVNSAINSCAASRSATPANCPFRYHDTSATVKWRIVTYPVIHVSINGGAVTFDDAGHGVAVHYDAATTDWLGFSETDSNDATVEVNGTASAGTTGVTVTFTR